MSIQFEEKSPSTSKRENVVGSRLTPFEKLPRIGSSNEYIPRPPPPSQTKHSNSKSNPRTKFLFKEELILIRIKLSDGRRLERSFHSHNTIGDIIHSIKSEQINFEDDFYLSSGDVPKRQFQNLNLTLKEANIQTRTMEIEKIPSGDFYRKLLTSAKIFLTEVDDRSSTSVNDYSNEDNRSLIPPKDSNINLELKSTRQECHQRLLTCSRRKLRLLSLQQQNDQRHSTFQKFIDNLDDKRCASIRRYQIELKDYLLKRLEADRLKQQLQTLYRKIDQLDEEKKSYSHIIQIVQKAIPLFPPGSLQGGSEGIKSLVSRYETLLQTKQQLEQRDFSNEKQERRRKLQTLILEHNTRVAQLSTRLAHLHSQLNSLQKNESIKEEFMINQMDLQRLNMTVKSQLQSSIHSLYDRYRLVHQVKSDRQPTEMEKLKSIEAFILYRMDLLQKSKSQE